MYNNVPIEQGLQAFEQAMNRREDKSIPTEFFMKVMRFVASSNVFVFDRQLFLQLLGVAMGSRSSPTFACIFMGLVELFMLFRWHEVGGLETKMWKRFIDDIFFLWQGTEEELVRFIQHLNSSHRTIKFDFTAGESFNFETKSVNFLDLQIFIDANGFIQTTLYQKECRVVAYLLPSSYHPAFICRNIPYSLGYRLRRIESILNSVWTVGQKNWSISCQLKGVYGWAGALKWIRRC